MNILPLNYGKFSADDLRLFLTLLPVLEKARSEVMESVRTDPAKVLSGPLSNSYWCGFYEKPIVEHLSLFIGAVGLAEEVKKLGETPHPMQAVVALVNESDTSPDDPSPEDAEAVQTALPVVISLVTSVYHSFRCLLVYGCYLNDLIARARQGDESAVFNAVRIDPSVLGCPSVVSRISRAVLLDDRRFFAKLKAALSGKVQKREQANFQKMRVILQVLSETGAGRLSDDRLHQLFVQQLRLYSSDSKRGDVKKNLRKFTDQYMKTATT